METIQKSKLNYEKDVAIDPDAIDVGCLDQPQLMLKVTRLEAELEKAEDIAKEKRDLVKAEIDKEVRSNPEKFKIEKVTEVSVTSAVLSDERYKKASAEYIDAKYESKCATGAVKSFEHRKSMLETLSKLHGQSYFAGPSVPHDLSKLKAEREKKTESNIGTRLRR
jgi:hypothetical protein